MESIGDRILRLRKEKEMNQKELAEKINITEASLSRYENNLREPKAEILTRIARVLGVSTDYLLGQTDIRKPSSNKNNDTKIITRAYQNLDTAGLSEEDIKKVEDYIEFLKQKYNPDGTLKMRK